MAPPVLLVLWSGAEGGGLGGFDDGVGESEASFFGGAP
jgi:hypothetical protein